jgi:hypothetical protein
MSNTTMLKEQRPLRYFMPGQPLDEQIDILDSLISTAPSDSARVYTISPELAEHILKARNGANRKPNQRKVDEYVHAMRTKRWPVTGSTIVFSKSGYLLDGQHRLLACTRAKVALTTFAAFNISDGSFALIDIGRKRSNVDAFTIQRVPHPGVASSAARWVMIHSTDPLNRGVTYTNDELYSFYKESLDSPIFHNAVAAAVAIEKAGKDRTASGPRRNYLPAGAMAAYLLIFSKINRKHAAEFADLLLNNKGHGRVYITAIRERMDANGGRLHEAVRNALLVQAWNAFRSEVRPSKAIFTWNLSGDFPEVR